MPSNKVKVFFDGGCRPNPGAIEVAVVVQGQTYIFDDLGLGNNADAEWAALNKALEICISLNLQNVELIGDAIEIIDKANGALKGAYQDERYTRSFLAFASKAKLTRIRWIKRNQNLAGIALAARHPR